MDRVRAVRQVAVVVVTMTFALMVLGSWVKATGSGLSCPDWPACYGQWFPPFPSVENGGVDLEGNPVVYSQAQILYEWAHRAVASLLGIPILVLLGLTLAGKELHPWLRRLPMMAVGVLVIQVLLGGITVIGKNAAPLTTAHLATATLFFFLVTMTLAFAFLRPLAHEPEIEVVAEAEPRFPGEPVVPRFPGEPEEFRG